MCRVSVDIGSIASDILVYVEYENNGDGKVNIVIGDCYNSTRESKQERWKSRQEKWTSILLIL